MSWELFTVKGDKEILRGFVHGFVSGIGKPQAAYCEAELPLEKESLAELLRVGPHHRVLVEASTAEVFAKALEATSSELGLHLKERRLVRKARFVAEAKAFSTEVMGTLRDKLLDKLPPGVGIAEKQEKKEEDASARGAELYAPVHQLQYAARITYQGEVAAILAWHKELSHTDFVEVSPIQMS
ncbi:MAG: hypothetical protein ACUVRQ_03130 [Thermoanaerobaculaceae bacterium]